MSPAAAGRLGSPRRQTSRPGLAGVGVGLRPVHTPVVLERGRRGALRVDFFEVVSENFMVPGGRPRRIVEEVRSLAPLLLHGVSMNLGSVDPLDPAYLDSLDALARRLEPAGVSDHLCWTGVDGYHLHDLLPLPQDEATVRHVSARIRRVQDRLGRRIAVENISSYLRFHGETMSEAEWISAVAAEADCDILLDVNNLFVSAWNHGFDAASALDAIPAERVVQIHLGGPSRSHGLWLDTHDHPVREEVWALYERTVARIGAVPTLIEWDDCIPDYDRLEEEALRARAVLDRVACGDETDGGRGDGLASPGRAPAKPCALDPGA